MRVLSPLLAISCLILIQTHSLPVRAQPLPRYIVTDLGVGEALSINNKGQVVGALGTANTRRAFLWTPVTENETTGVIQDLGTLSESHTFSQANGINELGQVVGISSGAGAGMLAFRTAPNSPINPETDNLGTLGHNFTQANAINASGRVVGFSDLGGLSAHAFRTAPNNPINPATDNINPFGAQNSNAHAINSSGQVVGATSGFGEDGRGFLITGNSAMDLGSLATPGSPGDIFWSTTANGINDAGQVVGNTGTDFESQYGSFTYHAFRTAPNSPINPATDDLGVLPGGEFSAALGINNLGHVVGVAEVASLDDHAFVFLGSGPLRDLNDLLDPATGAGWLLDEARDINDQGQIVGVGFVGGERHAFLLTPVPAKLAIQEMRLGLPHFDVSFQLTVPVYMKGEGKGTFNGRWRRSGLTEREILNVSLDLTDGKWHLGDTLVLPWSRIQRTAFSLAFAVDGHSVSETALLSSTVTGFRPDIHGFTFRNGLLSMDGVYQGYCLGMSIVARTIFNGYPHPGNGRQAQFLCIREHNLFRQVSTAVDQIRGFLRGTSLELADISSEIQSMRPSLMLFSGPRPGHVVVGGASFASPELYDQRLQTSESNVLLFAVYDPNLPQVFNHVYSVGETPNSYEIRWFQFGSEYRALQWVARFTH